MSLRTYSRILLGGTALGGGYLLYPKGSSDIEVEYK